MNYMCCQFSTQAAQDREENHRTKPATGYGQGYYLMPRCFKCGSGPLQKAGTKAICWACHATITKQEIEERGIDFERMGDAPVL